MKIIKIICLYIIFICVHIGQNSTARAQVVDLEVLPEWQLSQNFGNSRIYLKALLRERPIGAGRVVGTVAQSLALGQENTYFDPKLSFGIRPSIGFENNINGGLPFDMISVGPFIFTIDAASRSKRDIMVGARANVDFSFSISQGLTFVAGSQVGFRRAINYDLSVLDHSHSACLRYTSEYFFYTDACLSKSYIERKLSEEERKLKILSIGKVFDSSIGVHDFSFSVGRQEYLGRSQDRFRISTKTIVKDFGALDLGITFLEKKDRMLAQTFGLDLSYGTIILGKPTQVSASYLKEAGGNVFGLPRSDDRFILRASRNVSQSAYFFVSYERRLSTIPEFSENILNAGIEYRGLRW